MGSSIPDEATAKEVLASTEDVESPPLSPIDDSPPDLKKQASSSRNSSFSTDSDHTDSIHGENDEDGGDPEKQLSRHTSRVMGEQLSRKQTAMSTATNMTTDPAFEIDWEDVDPVNPQNWPAWKKAISIFFISYSTMTV